jgi:hypothetical protein
VVGNGPYRAFCPPYRLLLFNRDAGGADVELDAFRLLAVLIELIAEHSDHDDERADEEIEEVAAGHGVTF